MGRVNELRQQQHHQQDTASNTKRKGVGWRREGERGRKAWCARETRHAGKGKRLTFRDKAGEEGGKGGHWRDILGSDGDATTVPIRHLRETDRSTRRPTATTREPSVFLFMIFFLLSQFRLCDFLDNTMYLGGFYSEIKINSFYFLYLLRRKNGKK